MECSVSKYVNCGKKNTYKYIKRLLMHLKPVYNHCLFRYFDYSILLIMYIYFSYLKGFFLCNA